MSSAKQLALVIWLIGMSILIGLIVWYGADQIGQAVIGAGWATLLVVILRAVALAGAGAGWWLLFPRDVRPPLMLCMLLRFVREAANALLPLAQIGGDFVGARCLIIKGTRTAVAVASVIVDVLVQAATQLVFAIVGLVLLLAMNGGNELLAWPIAVGIAIAIGALGAFYFAQGRSGYHLLRKLLSLVVRDRDWRMFGAIDELYLQLQAFYGERQAILRSGVWHFAMWFVGAVEVWAALHFMGYPVTIEQAVVVESLMHAVRGAAFAIPGALGVQEGALIVLCSLYGIPPETAIGLSLVKRIPDLVIGVPGLVVWQAMEGWRLHSARIAGQNQKQV